jgi:hypothetical protein
MDTLSNLVGGSLLNLARSLPCQPADEITRFVKLE